jgi:very-short-patch-repair endonuclease
MLTGPRSSIARARKLRREMSLPEVLLWRELRQRPGGFKFRKQHPAGPYSADFFCHAARLVIEVDGEAHERGDRPERDAQRDAWFAERRFKVMRIPAVEVLSDLDAVVRGIVAAANPPLEGEGDREQNGRGVPALSIGAARAERLTPLRQASPATSPLGGGLEA